MSTYSDLQDIALQIPCSYCGAPADYWCTTLPSKRLATFLHASRQYPAMQAYNLGWAEGIEAHAAFPTIFPAKGAS